MNRANPSLWVQAGRYVAVSAAAALVVLVFRKWLHVNQTTVALTFLVLVLFTASRWRLACSVYLSILSTLLYNFFFLPPLGKLQVSDPQNWVALSVLLLTSVLVSQLSESERRETELSEARRAEVERLYEFSQELLLLEDPREVARAVPSFLTRIFKVRAAGLYLADGVHVADPGAILPSLSGVQGNSGEGGMGTPEVILVPLALGMKQLGSLVISRADYSQAMYEAIGTLVAIALEHASAQERFGRMEAAREGERLRGALLDSITHELRTPLTAIRAAATTLVSGISLGASEREEMYAIVDEESVRLDRLIGQAMEMAQLDANGVQVQRVPTSLKDLTESVVEELAQRLRGHSVEMRIADDLPNMALDPALMRRVLSHLVENAAKYSPAGAGIAIEAERADGQLLLRVADHGVGIEDADLPFIFDKLYRGTRQRGRVKGTGMGLAIVKAILRALGGGIDVKSKVGEGTIFTAWIPCEAVERSVRADDEELP